MRSSVLIFVASAVLSSALAVATPLVGRATSDPPALPENWVTEIACAVDDPGRVIANDVTTVNQHDTPASCVDECASKGFNFAGVEFSDECHCGTGFAGGVRPEIAPASDCNMTCTGNSSQICGGAWRIQIFRSLVDVTAPPSSPSQPATTAASSPPSTSATISSTSPAQPSMSTRPQRPPVSPVGWTTRFECATDVPTRVLADIETLLLDDNAPATCIAACAADGFTFAGVEFSDECHCGTGFAGGVPPQVAPTSNCDMACTGDADQTCGGVWSIEIFEAPGTN